MNTHIGHIARRLAYLGSFVKSPSPPPKASEDNDDDFYDDADDGDGDASLPSDDEMST